MAMSKEKAEALKRRKQKLCTVFVLCFLAILAIVGIIAVVAPKKGYSESEKRELASFPKFSFESLYTGKFSDELGIYVSDNFVGRDFLVDTNMYFRELYGMRGRENIKFYESLNGTDEATEILLENTRKKQMRRIVGNKYSEFILKTLVKLPKDERKKPNREIYEPDVEEDPNVVGEMRGSLFVLGDKALEVFGGNDAAGKNYADMINKYHDALGNSVKIYDLLIPTHLEYALTDKYRSKFKSQRPAMDNIFESLDPDIVRVDIYDTLKTRYKKGDYLYFRSDHHWTGLGAYWAYTDFAKCAGFEPVKLDSMEKREITPFLGSLYQSTKDVALKNNPDTVVYYVTDVPYTQTNVDRDGSERAGSLTASVRGESNGYLAFLGGDWPEIRIKTENHNGRKILVFKESYGNAFVPFLVSHYEEIYVADIRYFGHNAVDYIKQHGIGEVLFINGMFSANTQARINDTLSLMTK